MEQSLHGLPMNDTLDELLDKVRDIHRMRKYGAEVIPCPCGPSGQGLRDRDPVSTAVIHADGTLTCAECGKEIAIAE